MPTKKQTSAKRRPAARPAAKPLKAAAPARAAAPQPELAALRKDIATIRSLLESAVVAPRAAATAAGEEVEAVRRVLSDIVEHRMDTVVGRIVEIRNGADALGSGESRRLVEQLDQLLADLGAVRFDAERLEHVDPLIHVVARESHDNRLDDGVIAETIRPGFATGRGVILAKALVAVNRRL